MNRQLRTTTFVALLASAAVTTAACTGGGSGGGDGSSSGSSTTEGKAPAAVAEELLAARPQAPAVTMNGKLANETIFTGSQKPTIPAKIGVVSVRTAEQGTVLTLEVSADAPANVASLAEEGRAVDSPDLVTLVDEAGDKRYHVLRIKGGRCLCGENPGPVGPHPYRLTMMYPPLPEGVDDVKVEAPYFTAATAPVTR